ncbi:hypothetical protein EV424DRAFT_1344142 [Suillus variegatus]|nr:hypothetical protein EV424DRAFT_1344142 [Suillus variegatus]
MTLLERTFAAAKHRLLYRYRAGSSCAWLRCTALATSAFREMMNSRILAVSVFSRGLHSRWRWWWQMPQIVVLVRDANENAFTHPDWRRPTKHRKAWLIVLRSSKEVLGVIEAEPGRGKESRSFTTRATVSFSNQILTVQALQNGLISLSDVIAASDVSEVVQNTASATNNRKAILNMIDMLLAVNGPLRRSTPLIAKVGRRTGYHLLRLRVVLWWRAMRKQAAGATTLRNTTRALGRSMFGTSQPRPRAYRMNTGTIDITAGIQADGGRIASFGLSVRRGYASTT